jgi:hypothetical protein
MKHAQTSDGRWICDVCWRYDVCVDGKRKELGLKFGEKSHGGCVPCEDSEGRPIPCKHRPRLVTKFSK